MRLNRRTLTVALAVVLAAACARADVVTARWGVAGRIQHANALKYEPAGDRRTLMIFDLSALPKGSKVYRARLFFSRGGSYGSAFDIVPVQRIIEEKVTKDKDGKEQKEQAVTLKETGRALALAEPHWRWFDATGAARTWAAAGEKEALLLLRKAPGFDQNATYIEIAYEGAAKSPPKQVSQMTAFCRSGQVFISFKEIEDFAGGKDEVTWGDLATRFADINFEGPIPRDDKGELRYRVYTHSKPITRETLGEAEFIAEAVPGSIYNTRLVPGGDFMSRRAGATALRIAIEPEKPLPHGTGLFVHTVRQQGNWYYAVVTSLDGVENTVQFSAENTAGPIAQRPAAPEPVLQRVNKTDLRNGRTYHEQWYSYWAVPPQAPRPTRYDLGVGLCPETMTHPAPLTFTRGHTWGPGPEMPGPAAGRGVVMSMNTDPVNGYWTGVNDARYTLKGIEEGAWKPFTHNRQEALIRWAQKTWETDDQQIVGSIGAWGMWEIKRPDLYAWIHGWGMPEVTKGFLCWDWARGAWGGPELYQGKPDDENPWVLQDYTAWALRNPERELPYFQIHTGWGAHFTEMGWPPYPRFVRAMIDTKRAFCMQSRSVGAAMGRGIITIRRDQSLPAFGNCSLDSNIGDGDLRCGEPFGQINGYLVWESDTIVDEPGLYEITVYLWDDAPLDSCTLDLTPRRCQRFKAAAGTRFTWTNITAADGKQAGSGEAVADEHGLVTIKSLAVTKGKHRIRIQPRCVRLPSST